MANECKDCGCTCTRCTLNDHDVQLHVEIENLKQKLVEKENHIVTMETNFLNETNNYPNGELSSVKEELLTWQDKYKRLYEAHRRVQRVNQGLEDKLLKLVDVCETEKTALTKDVATLSHKLADANYNIKKLKEENERYKNDVSLAIQFLQCKQSNFVAHRYDTLPPEVQSQVSNYMTAKRKPEAIRPPPEVKSIKVPIPTFPPTAMVYSVPKSPNPERKPEPEADQQVDIVSAAIMAKVLEERQRERSAVKHCDTCTCAKGVRIVHHTSNHHVGTQTGDYRESVCLRCNEAMQSVASMKIVRTVEPIAQKIVPVYPLVELPLPEPVHNVAKVQPNNFLAELSTPSSPVDSDDNKIGDNNNSLVRSYRRDTSTIEKHHRLCDQSKPISYETESVSEMGDSEKPEDSTKGPRYASMRMQKNRKNILLDNAHNNIAPVLYTRPNKPPSETGSDQRRQQQRVADWIRRNVDGAEEAPETGGSSDNSRSDDADRARYAEMEENVKRFLFGESEFLRTVEIGRNKYKNFARDEIDGNIVK
ncbi:unnamed protein product [Phyllotreta striolata]|uniref:Tight junction-associated protein 1 n=1 Tax=Phyllotreta striolata TaxID=444603 RepID=A0A9N9TKE0_PHYSR|nr:unnamed protein product [Phyllotreta striolata]